LYKDWIKQFPGISLSTSLFTSFVIVIRNKMYCQLYSSFGPEYYIYHVIPVWNLALPWMSLWMECIDMNFQANSVMKVAYNAIILFIETKLCFEQNKSPIFLDCRFWRVLKICVSETFYLSSKFAVVCKAFIIFIWKRDEAMTDGQPE